jgi:hypothetical protein
MKIKRFEDIEAWQLSHEVIGQPVMQVYQKNREPGTVNQIT